MYRHLLIIIVSIFLFYTSSAAQDFIAGPLAGVTFSQIDGDTYTGFNKPGVNFGAFVIREIDSHWDVQGEITYTQKGARKYPKPDEGDFDDYKVSLGYIQFPLLGVYKFNAFSLEGGISIGSLISSYEAKDQVKIPEATAVPFQNIEWATLLGFNYYFSQRAWVNVRMSYSINRIRIPFNGEIPVYDPKAHWLSNEPGQYNSNLFFTLYYAFNRSRSLN